MTWDPKDFGLVACGSIVWQLSMVDLSEIDSDLFTFIDFNSSRKTLEVNSNDLDKVGSYEFEVKLYYESRPSVFLSTNFFIFVKECNSDSLDIDAGLWLDEVYYIFNDVKSLTWDTEVTGVPDCGDVSWGLEMSDGSLIDSAVFISVDFKD